MKSKTNDFLKEALEKLRASDIEEILMWLLEKKKETYQQIINDTDYDNNLIGLNELEDKLRLIFVNLAQKEAIEAIEKQKQTNGNS
jgi:nitrogen-specific signal transduction histidine kinase